MVGASGAGFGKVSVDAKAAASKAAATNTKKAGGTSGAKKTGAGAAAKKLTGGSSGSAKKGGGGGLIAAAKEEAKVDEAAAAAAAAKAAEDEAAAKAAEEAAAAAAAEAAAVKAAEDAAAAEKAAAEKAKINGECVVRYNHYDTAFPVVDGVLNWEHVDVRGRPSPIPAPILTPEPPEPSLTERRSGCVCASRSLSLSLSPCQDKYAISFVFKGNWTCHLIEWVGGAKGTPTGEPLLPDTGALHIEMRKDPDGFDPDEEEEKWCGTFSGLSVVNAEGAPMEYRLVVQEDAVWEAAQGPKTTYKAADTSKPTGPKMESCSCIEGNPCADAYCCKDCASSRLCNLARTHAPVPCPSHARPCPSTLAFPQRPARARARLWGWGWLSCHALHRNGLRRAKPIWLLSPRREEPIRGGQEEWVEGILIAAHGRSSRSRLLISK